jgi:DNA segregation ATPase FtsK/SpoIIIE, S-DNA-T family
VQYVADADAGDAGEDTAKPAPAATIRPTPFASPFAPKAPMATPATPATPTPAAGPAPTPSFMPAAAPAAAAPKPAETAFVARTSNAGWELPNFRELLAAGVENEVRQDLIDQQKRIIEETLDAFGAPGRVVVTNPGPVITQFGVEPDYSMSKQGKKRVKVNQIANLDADLALALAAKSIRIEAPVPGKGYVGIEVPNPQASVVGLRDIMASPAFGKLNTRLRIAFGKSIDGTPIVADLTQMPHMLIAGTTGSGKSVCVNSIIACLLLENAPDELQFIMVDPKRVELTGYNGIPHLVSPVVVDLERIVGVLKWVTREMDDRYKKFAAISARNIIDYNSKIGPGDKRIPYLVVIIDELADLMMLAPDETEKVLTRLAQMARATGIHLILSTQRPSVDVVTGLIKANFPSRIAFAVASGVDSRVILDQPGAEKLLGRGDMLYQAPDAPAPMRAQGVFLSDAEINRITKFWKDTQKVRGIDTKPPLSVSAFDSVEKPDRNSGIFGGKPGSSPKPGSTPRSGGNSGRIGSDRMPASGGGRFGGLSDPGEKAFFDAIREPDKSESDEVSEELYQSAVALFRRTNRVSVSAFQRQLNIGYNQAAKIMDLMKTRGVLGSKPVESADDDSGEG